MKFQFKTGFFRLFSKKYRQYKLTNSEITSIFEHVYVCGWAAKNKEKKRFANFHLTSFEPEFEIYSEVYLFYL